MRPQSLLTIEHLCRNLALANVGSTGSLTLQWACPLCSLPLSNRSHPHLSTYPVIIMKIEPGVHIVIDLFKSFNEDAHTQSNHGIKPSPPSQRSSFGTPFPCYNAPSFFFPPPSNRLFPLFNVYVEWFICAVGKTS